MIAQARSKHWSMVVLANELDALVPAVLLVLPLGDLDASVSRSSVVRP